MKTAQENKATHKDRSVEENDPQPYKQTPLFCYSQQEQHERRMISLHPHNLRSNNKGMKRDSMILGDIVLMCHQILRTYI